MGEYTKMAAVRGSHVHRDIVRHQLTKNLGRRISTPRDSNHICMTNYMPETLIPQMKEEADWAFGNILSGCNSKGNDNN